MNTSNDLTPDEEEVDFLLTWLMHHGIEWTDRASEGWYGRHRVSIFRPVFKLMFDRGCDERANQFRLNKRGLAAIEQGAHHEQTDA